MTTHMDANRFGFNTVYDGIATPDDKAYYKKRGKALGVTVYLVRPLQSPHSCDLSDSVL